MRERGEGPQQPFAGRRVGPVDLVVAEPSQILCNGPRSQEASTVTLAAVTCGALGSLGADRGKACTSSASPGFLVSVSTLTVKFFSLPRRFVGGQSDCFRLFGEDLLPQDVSVPAVLRELSHHVKVNPAHGQCAPPIAVHDIVQRKGRHGSARGRASFAMGSLH